jgi:hypothetical protein
MKIGLDIEPENHILPLEGLVASHASLICYLLFLKVGRRERC